MRPNPPQRGPLYIRMAKRARMRRTPADRRAHKKTQNGR
ncbi:hypothetical protein Y026_4831 [Burkholderia pseudomallei TSV28]|nr:hypothetical protein Y026_4831 [Burkholderia pseudomallei TSV28]